MDNIKIIFAKLKGLQKSISSMTARKAKFLDPQEALHYFKQYAKLRDEVETFLPELYSDLITRDIPKASGTTDFDGRGYITASYLNTLLRDIDYIFDVYNNSKEDGIIEEGSKRKKKKDKNKLSEQTDKSTKLRENPDLKVERKKIHFFISYAQKDSEISDEFIDAFDEITSPSYRYEYIFWQDTNILPGEKWSEEIQLALRKCDFGLLLISPSFLSSKYIDSHELPRFVGSGSKPMIPVMLKQVNLKRHNLKGLEERQIYRFKPEGSKDPKSYAKCGSNQRDDFIYDFFDKVESRLDKLYS